MVPERRKECRKTPTEFTFIQLEQEFSGRLVNISAEGLCFETLSPISETPLVQFWFCYRTQGEVDGVGRVMWLNQTRNLGGIKFVHLSRTSRERLREWVDPRPALETTHGEEPEGEGPKDPAPADGVEPEASRLVETPETFSGGIALPSTLEQETTKPADPSGEAVGLKPTGASNDVALPPRPNTPRWVPSGEGEVGRTTAGQPFPPARARPAKWPISRETEGSSSFLPVDGRRRSGDEAASGKEGSTEEAEASSGPAPQLPSATSDAVSRGSHRDPWFAGPTREAEDQTVSPRIAERDELENTEGHVTTELVPLNKYRYAKRSQFALGAGLGILICSVILIPLIRYSKQPPRTILAREPLPRAVSADSNGGREQASESIPRPTPSGAGNSKAIPQAQGSRKSLKTRTKELTAPDFSASSPADQESPDTLEASESEGKNAVPTPHTFAFREPPSENRSALLFEVPKVGNPGAEVRADSTVSGPSAAQVAPEIDLASNSVSFHTKTRVGIAPVGGDVQPAKLIRSVLPDYPGQARIERMSGDVVIDITIDATGKVAKMQVLSGQVILRDAALRAVGQWKYEPARLDGKPAATHATVTVRFLAK